MPTNMAAWLAAKHTDLKVGPAAYTAPGENEVVVKNRAVAINPVDWMIPVVGDMVFPWLKYPAVLGSDVAGDVVEIGGGVSRFKVGDRVLGQALGTSQARFGPSQGAFQTYTVLQEHMTCPIPDSLSYESAVVLPLGLSTAACGLFQKDFLMLQDPSAAPKPTGKTLVIWGGSTSVGSNAIQLAVAAGYEVFTTSSPANFAYVKALGASQAFDYRSKTVAKQMIAALKGKTIAGALAIGTGSADICLDIVHACDGDKFLATASPAVSFSAVPRRGGLSPELVQVMVGFVWSNLAFAVKTRLLGVKTKFIFGDSLANNEVGKMIYEGFLPSALAEGRYRAAPDPVVVGTGLDQVQTGFAAQAKGVSAKKVVVSL